MVQDVKDKVELCITQLQETRSHRSSSSKHSSRSYRSPCSRSSALSDRLLEARISAEQSKVRRSYIEKEALARAEMEEKIALAQVRLLEQALSQSLDPVCLPPQEIDDPFDRTSDYVRKELFSPPPVSSNVQAKKTETSKSVPPAVPAQPTAPEQANNHHPDTPSQGQLLQQDEYQVFSGLPPQLKQQSSESTEAKPQLNPAATSFYPGTSHPFTPSNPYAPGAPRVVTATSSEKSDMSEFARFMVSRELINTSLSKFDDCAESYRAWKATFKAAIANLNLTTEQELDLMIKWLGPGSTNRIKSLRTVYVGQAEAGLAAAWQRLERTFGSAEAIEKALFKRLNIPKINLKEVHKLQDLCDLLMEVELAKRDPCLSGLCFLDTAHGVNPIVVKLPYSLQEKWATSVSRYKRAHDVTFPPFIHFCRFIDEQAQIRNDPSLDFLEFNTKASATSSSRYENAMQ
ncbi:LOW QUALITY PROTEIN: uncharacterized protein PAF06_007453 [Gastrophryne carolinensis]